MKRFLMALALLSVLHFSEPVFSQATFIFGNYFPSRGLDAPVFDAAGNRLSGTDYVAVLYGGPTQSSLSPARLGPGVMPPVPFTYVPTGQSGYFREAGYVSVDGVPFGSYGWLEVRAWDMRLGQTYDEVVALGLGGHGRSALFYAQGGDVTIPFPAQPLIGLQSFSLVPEPGAYVLFALGLGLLLRMCRQRGIRRTVSKM